MITSSLIQEPFVYMRHTVSDTPSVEEVTLAIEHTLQHSDLPVIWDLRKLNLNNDMLVYEDSVRTLVSKRRSEMSSKKRAFLVKVDVHGEFEAFLGRLQLPLSWGVFETSDAAIEWLQS